MSDQTKDGGPAFPVTLDHPDVNASGMSLRDWFAGMIAQGLLASTAEPDSKGYRPTILAEASYSFADAMLAQRSK